MSNLYESMADLVMASNTAQAMGLSRNDVLECLRRECPSEAVLLQRYREARVAAEARVAEVDAAVRAGRSYLVLGEGDAIQCLQCGAVSWHRQDIAHRYCGRCRKFHDDQGAA